LNGEAGAGRDGLTAGGQVMVVRLTVGRRPKQRYLTNAVLVGDLVAAAGVKLRPADIVRPESDSILRPGASVRVIRVRTELTTETITLPFRTLIQYSKELAPGSIRILTAGIEGSAAATYRVTYRNGQEVGRELVSQVVLTAPVDQVEQHPVTTAGAGSETGQASWYDWAGCGDGYHAAHKTLPFGTAVTVTDLDNGKSVTVTINDRGPYAAGRIIDLCPTAFAALAPLGQGVADVRISW
jgi:rare lipoprotein A